VFRWAVSTVMTRQNQIPNTETGDVDTALIPLWDMCNHSNGWVGHLIPLWDMCNHSNGWVGHLIPLWDMCNHSNGWVGHLIPLWDMCNHSNGWVGHHHHHHHHHLNTSHMSEWVTKTLV